MLESAIRQIQDLLKDKQTEDLTGELLLIRSHFEHVSFLHKEVEHVIRGINSGVPIPHILGYNIVCGAKIRLSSDVLNPGPETKTLAEKAIEYAKKLELPSVLDVCTGSGAIGISIAMNVCNSACIGTDISERAIEIAKKNAYENNVKMDFNVGDLFEPVSGRKFDIITANPPYVCSDAIESLPTFVKDFAPRIAIDGGKDGLFLHRKILENANIYLKPNGALFLECEDNQHVELTLLFERYCWRIEDQFVNRFGKVRGFKLAFCG